MPFVDPFRPSIQLGQLKSVTAAAGFPVRTLHAYLDFAVRIGVPYYEMLCQHRGPMIGEWLFSVAAFPANSPDPDGHLLRNWPGGCHSWGSHRQKPGKSCSGLVKLISRRIWTPWRRRFPGPRWRWPDSPPRSSRTAVVRAGPPAEAAPPAPRDGLRRGQLRR